VDGIKPIKFIILSKLYLMRKLFALLALGTSTFFLGGCDSDFSLNGDYEIQPIVFGLLDHTQDVHMFKITKAYLGNGDNLVYAQNPDSSYFNQVEGTVTEYLNGDPTGRTWTLQDTIVTNKSTDGIFYAPEQKAYFFEESDLDSLATYELYISLEGGKHEVTGSTELLPKFKPNKSSLVISDFFPLTFAPSTVDEDSDYSKWNFNLNEALNGAAYEFYYTFRWRETYTDNSYEDFAITRMFLETEQNKPLTPSVQSVIVNGLDVYQFIDDNIEPDANVTKRRFLGFDFRIAAAHYELKQYMDIGEPISGIAQVQPEFTNLNGARGLFSSRIVFDAKNFQFDANSIKQLCTGLYTADLGFCSHLAEHSSEFWYCN